MPSGLKNEANNSSVWLDKYLFDDAEEAYYARLAGNDSQTAHDSGDCLLDRELYEKESDEGVLELKTDKIHSGLKNEANNSGVWLDKYLFDDAEEAYYARLYGNAPRAKDEIFNEQQSLQERPSDMEKLNQRTQEKSEETLNSVVAKYEEKIAQLNMIIDKQRKLIETLTKKPTQL